MKQPRKQSKTRFIAYVAVSVDGRISIDPKKMPAWTSKDDWNFLQKSLMSADAVVVGRNTYLAAKKRLAKRRTFILTSRVAVSKKIGPFTFVNPVRADWQKIFAGYRQVAVLGGPRVYGEMLKQGLLDEIYITIEPVVFGYGKEMFAGVFGAVKLRLLAVRRLNHRGSLLLHYSIK